MGKSGSLPLLLLITKCVPPDLYHRATLQHLHLDGLPGNIRLTRSANLYPCPVDLHYRMLRKYGGILKQIYIGLLLAADDGARLVENELFARQRPTGDIEPTVFQSTLHQSHRDARRQSKQGQSDASAHRAPVGQE